METASGREFALTCKRNFDAGYNEPVAQGKGKKAEVCITVVENDHRKVAPPAGA